MIFAQENGRVIPEGDRIFSIGNRAKKMIKEKGADKVVNATVGTLLDDEGKLIVLTSVVEAIKDLTPSDYAAYAPISGIPRYKEAVKTNLFRGYKPKRYVEVCATPGGAGAIRNAVSNYTRVGDKVLTTDWYWAPYATITGELCRSIDTFEMFEDDIRFNLKAFEAKVKELSEKQETLLVILNTPAHNPTGYSLSKEDWNGVVEVLNKASKDATVTLLMDLAYIDFAGEEDEQREFFKYVEELSSDVMCLAAYSASKTFTLYGMRCGALVCLAPTAEAAKEFKMVNEYSSRASWSNSTRASQVVLSNITESKELRSKVTEERAKFREMLLKRGHTFSKAMKDSGIPITPFKSGFFCCVECDDPDGLSAKLEKEGVFAVPLAKGVRVSVASISEEKCIRAAETIAKIMK